jgi:L-threonylcarbamoyladenylate synthase
MKTFLSEMTRNEELWQAIISSAVTVLREGGVAVLPTETSYMLAVNATDLQAIDRIRTLKGRPLDMQFSVAFADVSKASMWTVWDSVAQKLAARFLPGPLTIILPKRLKCPPVHASEGQTLGVRIPDFPPLLDILDRVDFPVTATSANPHGGPEPYSPEMCISNVNFFLDIGTLPRNTPSTIIDVSGAIPRIIREGAISAQRILSFLNRSETE